MKLLLVSLNRVRDSMTIGRGSTAMVGTAIGVGVGAATVAVGGSTDVGIGGD